MAAIIIALTLPFGPDTRKTLAAGAFGAMLLSWVLLRVYDSRPVIFTQSRYEGFVHRTLRSALGRDVRILPRFTENTRIEHMRPGEWGWVAAGNVGWSFSDQATEEPGPYYISPQAYVQMRPTPMYSVLVYRESDDALHCIQVGPGCALRHATDSATIKVNFMTGPDYLPTWTFG
ncbi:MAG TPA: hypothetical protein VJM32_05575 [Candidatus Saccharimonadales bacterium]|nr:hypothetical protein [Candidatus Saccharimonadales bacterium]